MNPIISTFDPHSSELRPQALRFAGRLAVPNNVREALLAQNLGEAAILLDALLWCGVRVGQLLTVKQIVERLQAQQIGMSEGLIRRGLNLGVFRRGKLKQGRGRPLATYIMPGMTELQQTYADGWQSSFADPIMPEDMASLKLYRQALHREFIARAPGAYSRAFLAGRLGVSERTTRNYDRRVGVIAEQRIARHDVMLYDNWDLLARDYERKAAGRRHLWLEITRYFDDYSRKETFKAPMKVGIMYAYAAKAEVKIAEQLSNTYRIDPILSNQLRPTQLIPY